MARIRWTGTNLDQAEDAFPGEVIAQVGQCLLLPVTDSDTEVLTAWPGDTVTRTGPDQYRIN
jgi:hypothetical protein